MREFLCEDLMKLAEEIRGRSECMRARVGAVLSRDGKIISTGYNGPPEKVNRCDEWPSGCPERIGGGCFMGIHAEQNAIIHAVRRGILLDGSVIYVTMAPCLPCAKMIYSVGIVEVIYGTLYSSYKGGEEEGLNFLDKLRIKTVKYKIE